AALAELPVRRPVGRVESAPRRCDCSIHVRRGGIRGLTDHLFGRGIDVLVGALARRPDELAVDQHAALGVLDGHGVLSSGCFVGLQIERRSAMRARCSDAVPSRCAPLFARFTKSWTSLSQVKPIPPWIWMASLGAG